MRSSPETVASGMNCRLWVRWAIPCVCGLAGAAAGWLLKPDTPVPVSRDSSRTAPVASVAAGAANPKSSPRVQETAPAAHISQMLQTAGQLSPAEFGEHLAELLAKPTFGEVLVERGILVSLLDGERMAAVYEAYKRRTGTTAMDEHQELRDLLLAASQKDGKGTMERLLAVHPDGFMEMGSVAYGWAMSNPQQAVDWLNTLEDESQSRKKSLRGLMSGLAAGNGDLAGQVLTSLAPEDKQPAATGFANSMIQNHGLERFEQWLSKADPEVAKLAIQQSSFRADQQPSPVLVPWLASHADAVPVERLNSAFQKWTRSDPDGAIEWALKQSPDVSKPHPVLRAFAESDPATVDQWAGRHPNHPAAIEWAKRTGSRSR